MVRRISTLFLTLAFVLSAASPQAAPKRAPDVPYEPSSPEIVAAMLKLGKVSNRDMVYDLGCGDGRIVITAAKQFGAHGIGIDIDPVRISEAQENARKAGVAGRVTFRTEDLFEADFRKATVVMLYLWPEVNLKLLPKLLKDLRPGTRIVSHSHDMGEWKPEKTVEVEGHSIHFWTVPAKKK
jgi:SAM-dependent methyltransferase